MRAMGLFLCGLFMLYAQTTLPYFLHLEALKANFLLILVVHMGFYLPTVQGSLLAYLLGYCEDMLSGSINGVFALISLLIFLLARYMKRRIYLENILVEIGIVSVAALIQFLVLVSILGIVSYNLPDIWIILKGLLREMIILSVTCPLFFLFLRGLERRLVLLERGKE